MSKHKITFISDTHGKHNQIVTSKSLRKNDQPLDLPGGDILIHAGDFMNAGWNEMEAVMFFKWFDEIDNYDTKILIAGKQLSRDMATVAPPLILKLLERLLIGYLTDTLNNC